VSSRSDPVGGSAPEAVEGAARASLPRTVLLAAIGLPATAFFSLVSLVGGLLHAPRGLHDWVHRTWSRLLLALAGIRVRVEGLEHIHPGAAQVVVANHQSLFDILALFASLPVSLRFIAKIELSRIPLFGGAMRQAGHVFIDRSDLRQSIRAMRRAGERMKEEGLTLGMFPEGTRSRDGRLHAFKKGSFVLAIETGTRLVPVAIQGGRAILPPEHHLLRPAPMCIRCAPALELEQLEREDRDTVLRETREAIAGLLEEGEGRG